jgi:putative PIN family toxin of toxin-antitoxin system
VRVVLDTNVLISGIVWAGRCEAVINHCSAEHTGVTSRELLDELERKLLGKFRFDVPEAEEVLDALFNRFRIVGVNPLPYPVSRDPDDDVVLATAVSGKCDLIITGDKDLLDLGTYQGIRILSPGAFWTMEHPQS